MSKRRHIGKQVILKIIFSLGGLALFATQVSYKFYESASMPVFRVATAQQASNGFHPLSGEEGTNTLRLDKRFDAKPFFALPAPIFRVRSLTGFKPVIFPFLAPAPVDNTMHSVLLRGPPAVSLYFC